MYQRLKFNIVNYDGNPDGWIEPRNISDMINGIETNSPNLVTTVTEGAGAVARFEMITNNPWAELHRFD